MSVNKPEIRSSEVTCAVETFMTFVESATTMARCEDAIIARLTSASCKLALVIPREGWTPLQPMNARSAFNSCRRTVANGLMRECCLSRRVPPVKTTVIPACRSRSSAIFSHS